MISNSTDVDPAENVPEPSPTADISDKVEGIIAESLLRKTVNLSLQRGYKDSAFLVPTLLICALNELFPVPSVLNSSISCTDAIAPSGLSLILSRNNLVLDLDRGFVDCVEDVIQELLGQAVFLTLFENLAEERVPA